MSSRTSLNRQIQITYLSVFLLFIQDNMSVSPCGEMLLRNKNLPSFDIQVCQNPPSSYNIVVSLAIRFVILLIVPVLIVPFIVHRTRSRTHPLKEGTKYNKQFLFNKLFWHSATDNFTIWRIFALLHFAFCALHFALFALSQLTTFRNIC